ncbi:hypothetical protein HPB52_023750 [Rhipicephalus sanguineus]|uniref:Uncharacterized protein n=1 Tax=Rhipicephalus sanguineus TaxID=34632 RepID=A0A9D4Q4G1_RHISA|nr:hypothetical protein HPB52_023750 [Rhipicephalus sanguineus]
MVRTLAKIPQKDVAAKAMKKRPPFLPAGRTGIPPLRVDLRFREHHRQYYSMLKGSTLPEGKVSSFAPESFTFTFELGLGHAAPPAMKRPRMTAWSKDALPPIFPSPTMKKKSRTCSLTSTVSSSRIGQWQQRRPAAAASGRMDDVEAAEQPSVQGSERTLGGFCCRFCRGLYLLFMLALVGAAVAVLVLWAPPTPTQQRHGCPQNVYYLLKSFLTDRRVVFQSNVSQVHETPTLGSP